MLLHMLKAGKRLLGMHTINRVCRRRLGPWELLRNRIQIRRLSGGSWNWDRSSSRWTF